MHSPLHAALMLPVVVAALLSLLLLFQALMPVRTGRASGTLEAHPWRSLGLGLATALLLILLLKTMDARLPGSLKILALPVLACALVFPAGLGVVSELVGRRLLGAPERRLACLLLGGPVTLVASAIPFLGWFAVLPLSALSGAGALVADAVRPAAKG